MSEAQKPKEKHLFQPGNKLGANAGRPPGYNQAVRKAAMEKIEDWFTDIFIIPEAELMEKRIDRDDTLKTQSRADRIIYENSKKYEVIMAIMDRLLPKLKPIEESQDDKESVEEIIRKAKLQLVKTEQVFK
jgi:hypothetical protein